MEIKELTKIQKTEAGTIVADFKVEDKTTKTISYADLKTNLDKIVEDLNGIKSQKDDATAQILELQSTLSLLDEKESALTRSKSVIDSFMSNEYVVEENSEERMTEEESTEDSDIVEEEAEAEVSQVQNSPY
jgi:hypothetical protein